MTNRNRMARRNAPCYRRTTAPPQPMRAPARPKARATYATWRRRAHARQKRIRHHATVWQSHESAARTTETRRTPPPQTTDDNPHSQQCTPSRQPNEAATTIRPHSPYHPRQRWPRTDVRPPTTATSPTCSTTKTLRSAPNRNSSDNTNTKHSTPTIQTRTTC